MEPKQPRQGKVVQDNKQQVKNNVVFGIISSFTKVANYEPKLGFAQNWMDR